MKIKQGGIWKDGRLFTKRSGVWAQSTLSSKLSGQWKTEASGGDYVLDALVQVGNLSNFFFGYSKDGPAFGNIDNNLTNNGYVIHSAIWYPTTNDFVLNIVADGKVHPNPIFQGSLSVNGIIGTPFDFYGGYGTYVYKWKLSTPPPLSGTWRVII